MPLSRDLARGSSAIAVAYSNEFAGKGPQNHCAHYVGGQLTVCIHGLSRPVEATEQLTTGWGRDGLGCACANGSSATCGDCEFTSAYEAGAVMRPIRPKGRVWTLFGHPTGMPHPVCGHAILLRRLAGGKVIAGDCAEEPDHERVAAVEAQARGLDLGRFRGRRPARPAQPAHAREGQARRRRSARGPELLSQPAARLPRRQRTQSAAISAGAAPDAAQQAPQHDAAPHRIRRGAAGNAQRARPGGPAQFLRGAQRPRSAAARLDHAERALRADRRQLRGRGFSVGAARRLPRRAAAARALPVQARRQPRRAVAALPARPLAARAPALSLPLDRPAAAAAGRGRLARDPGRDGLTKSAGRAYIGAGPAPKRRNSPRCPGWASLEAATSGAKFMSTTGWIVLGVIVVIVLWAISVYNGLIALRQRVGQAGSDIDVQLKQRHDLVPNLVETVKGYAGHERGTLEAVVQARNAAMAAQGQGPAQQAAAENMLSGALRQLFALSEAYPNLKANTNFQELQAELTDLENKIAASRRFFNNAVQEYNTGIQQFPAALFASTFGFTPHEYFEAGEERKVLEQAPQVKFRNCCVLACPGRGAALRSTDCPLHRPHAARCTADPG